MSTTASSRTRQDQGTSPVGVILMAALYVVVLPLVMIYGPLVADRRSAIPSLAARARGRETGHPISQGWTPVAAWIMWLIVPVVLGAAGHPAAFLLLFVWVLIVHPRRSMARAGDSWSRMDAIRFTLGRSPAAHYGVVYRTAPGEEVQARIRVRAITCTTAIILSALAPLVAAWLTPRHYDSTLVVATVAAPVAAWVWGSMWTGVRRWCAEDYRITAQHGERLAAALGVSSSTAFDEQSDLHWNDPRDPSAGIHAISVTGAVAMHLRDPERRHALGDIFPDWELTSWSSSHFRLEPVTEQTLADRAEHTASGGLITGTETEDEVWEDAASPEEDDVLDLSDIDIDTTK